MHIVHARFQSHGNSPHSWLIPSLEDPFEQGRYLNRFRNGNGSDRGGDGRGNHPRREALGQSCVVSHAIFFGPYCSLTVLEDLSDIWTVTLLQFQQRA